LPPLTEAVAARNTTAETERVVAFYLTDAIWWELGHEVTLFASGGQSDRKRNSRRSGPALCVSIPALKDYFGAGVSWKLETVARRAHEFDVIPLRIWDYFGYPLLQAAECSFGDDFAWPPRSAGSCRLCTGLYGDVPVVSISDSQRGPLPSAHYVATISHGLPQDLLAKGAGTGGYLAFLGPHFAGKRRRNAGHPDRRQSRHETEDRGGRSIRVDEEYFKTSIEPLLSQDHVEFIGEIGEHQKGEFLGNAAGFAVSGLRGRRAFRPVMNRSHGFCGTR